MKKIFVIGTGGTVGAKSGNTITLDQPLKIVDLYKKSCDVAFVCDAPFQIFSEHADLTFLEALCTYMQQIDYAAFCGVILLHGSDTLAFTGALLAHLLPDKPIVLVGANQPPEQPSSNGLKNFDAAVQHLTKGPANGVFISYDGLHPAWKTTSADGTDTFRELEVPFIPIERPALHPKKILVITPHPGIEYNSFRLHQIDAVLHTMYHSATVPQQAQCFADACKAKNIPFYFVTHRTKAPYATAESLTNILYQTTLESAFAKLLLTK